MYDITWDNLVTPVNVPRQFQVTESAVSAQRSCCPPWEKTPTLWKIQRLPCDAYGICWREMSIWVDFTDKYVLESISNRI